MYMYTNMPWDHRIHLFVFVVEDLTKVNFRHVLLINPFKLIISHFVFVTYLYMMHRCMYNVWYDEPPRYNSNIVESGVKHHKSPTFDLTILVLMINKIPMCFFPIFLFV